MPNLQRQFQMQRRPKGVNSYLDAQDLPDDEWQQADNVFVDGSSFLTRWGKQGTLTQADVTARSGAANYGLLSFVTMNSTVVPPTYQTWFLFVCGGKIYRQQLGTTTSTEVKIGGSTSFALNSPTAYLERVGRFVYVVDGNTTDTPIPGGTPLYRISMDASGTPTTAAYVGQLAPTTAPAASLTATTIDDLTSLSLWQEDLVTGDGTNVLPNRGDLSLFQVNNVYSPGTGVGITWTDLVIGAANTLTSVAFPLTQALVGQSIVIASGTGFTPGTYLVDSVTTAGVATMHTSPGTNGSTGGHGSIASVWTTVGSDIDFWTSGFPEPHVIPAAYTGTFCLPDDPGEGITTTHPIINAAISNAVGETRYARQFKASLQYYCPQNPNKQGFTMQLDVYSDTAATTLLATTARSFIPNTSVGQQPGQSWVEIFDFPSLGAEIRSYKFTVTGANSNKKFFGVYFSSLSLAPISNQFTLLQNNGMYLQNGYTAQGNGPANNGRFGGAILTKVYAADQDWSAYARVTLNLSTAGSALDLKALSDAGLTMRLGLRQSASSTHNYSNTLTIDPTSGTASVDITTIPLSIRQQFRYFEIDFLADLTSAPVAFTPLFTITSVSSGGNLSVANAQTGAVAGLYSWLFTEVNGRAATISSASNASPIAVTTSTAHNYQTGDEVFIFDVLGNTAANGSWFIVVTSNTTFTLTGSTGNGAYTSGGTVLELSDVIESDPSPISAQLQTTLALASAKIVLPTPINTGLTTYYFLYRYGGIFDDGIYRLVAILPTGTNSLPATSPGTSATITWDHTTKTVIDNAGDGVLQNALAVSLITGRGLPPTGAQAIAEFQGRVWLAKGSKLFASWLIDESNPSALYFNEVNPGGNDPEEAIKGIQATAGGNDNDPIQRLVPLSTYLVTLKSRSVWVLTGFDANDFTLTGYLKKAQVGLVAPRAVAIVNNAIWFLGPDGVYQFDADVVVPVSVQIEKLLNPAQSGGTAISAAAYAKCSMLYAGRRLYLFAPQVGDSANTCAYVWDSRQEGWTRFLGMNMSGGDALCGGADNPNIYLAGLDGQIYQLTGAGDKAYSDTVSASAVQFTVKSRGMGQEGSDIGYWYENQPARIFGQVVTGETATITYSITAAGGEPGVGPLTFTQDQTFQTGREGRSVTCDQSIRGDYMTVGLTGSTVTQTRIIAVGVEYTEGKPD